MRFHPYKISFPAFVLIIVILAGCAGTAPLPAQPVQAFQPSMTALARLAPTRPPTATAAIFELRPTNTPLPTATPPPADQVFGFGYGPTGFPNNINPLTGLQVSDPSLLERRPMVIKITNFPRSVRPQWGLSAADHIYEYYLEDELTRFIGVFYGQDASRVGPIRSARPFDENIVRTYKAIFAFGYADDRVFDLWKDSDIRNFLVVERPDNCPPLCRIGPSNAYNTLFTDTAQLSKYITDKGTSNSRQDLNGLRFEENSLIAFGGGQVDRLNLRFSPESYNYWQYDPAGKRYLRWQDLERRPEGEEDYAPLFDSLSGQQIAADNIVILHVPASYFFLSHSTEIFDFSLKGQGKGYALRNGKIFEIEWGRPKPDSMISIVLPGGAPYPFKPGNVWFEVFSNTTTHTFLGTTWDFGFSLPPTPSPTPAKKPKKP